MLILVLGTAQSAIATPVNSNSIIADGIEYYVQSDKAVYDVEDNIEMLYKVTNLTSEPVTFSFS